MIQFESRVRLAPFWNIPQEGWTRFSQLAKAELAQFFDERFRTSTDPQGRLWKPLKPTTLKRAVGQARARLGGRAARPITTRVGTRTVLRATRPIAGFQKTATVRRTRLSKPLVNTGRLRASVVAPQAPNAIRRVMPYTILWGTNLSYAKYHQYGTSRIPARPFIGVSYRLQQRLQTLLNRTIAQAIQSQRPR